jgi:HTH-type transcriptional regulator / antitoxin HigA
MQACYSESIVDTSYRTPAQMIEAHMQQRNWTQRILAKILGLTETKVSNIMNNHAPVTTEIALQLQAVLAIDANELLKLQTAYHLARAQLEFRIDPDVKLRARVFGDFPITEIIKRGWLPGITDIKDAGLEGALCKFLKVESIDAIESMPHAAKKTDAAADVTPAQLLWLSRVREMATDYPSAKYASSKLEAALAKMQSLLVSPEGVSKVPKLLMEAGVRFVIVESIPTAKIDGVCCWLGAQDPVIGMSLRFDRIDNFWFVLRHEIEHVLRGDGQQFARLDTEMEQDISNSDLSEEERLANSAAAEFCVPGHRLRDFISRKAPVFAERDIRGFAATLRRHPGIIAGQLQHRTKRYDLFRNHLVKVRSIILPTAEHDGWGDVAQIG